MTLKCLVNKHKKCDQERLKLKIDKPQDLEYFRRCKKNLYHCINCDILRQFPTSSLKEIESYYDKDYQVYTGSNNLFLSLLSKIYFYLYRKSIKIKKSDAVLDYGCGTGEILNNLAIEGYKNIYAFDFTKYKNLNSAIKFLEKEKQITNYKYDLIILNHVIEHVPNPYDLISFLKSVLKDDGKIIGQTPNWNDFTFKVFGNYWGPLHQPYHLNIFSKKTMSKLCKNLNLKIEITKALMPTGLSMSLENIIKKKFNLKSRGRLKIYPLLLIFSCFLNFFLNIFNSESSIINFKIEKIPK